MRAAILGALGRGVELATRDLLQEIPRIVSDGAGLGQVGYHCAVLDRAGLIMWIGGVWRRPR